MCQVTHKFCHHDKRSHIPGFAIALACRVTNDFTKMAASLSSIQIFLITCFSIFYSLISQTLKIRCTHSKADKHE
ncbi:hypothetical protein [Calothrix sp. NIES-2100]|uniref:hypothetical protein n=1 Tax=Calothrix sp. NIES-2100 TaxID=1954172 RepID=UPI0030D97DF4